MTQIKPESRSSTWQFMSPARTIFGILVALVAVALIAHLIYLDHVAPGRPKSRLAYCVLCMFALIGLAASFRGGATLDVERRTLTRWWGPFIPLRKQRIDFGQIHSVLIGPGPKPGSIQAARASQHTFYAAIQADADPVVVRIIRSPDDVRRRAQLIADAVGCPVLEEIKDPARQ